MMVTATLMKNLGPSIPKKKKKERDQRKYRKPKSNIRKNKSHRKHVIFCILSIDVVNKQLFSPLS